ncbi:hypothetical protein ACFQH3_01770 [Haladaptatus sp. GCM10025707]|uniref:DUF7519 family protein n=1 Tax=unclassified Haladaptatus TaxID=2622732 RepID=UPI0023E8457C|nr:MULTISPECIES: hypothetical protein [unclassified Haladaptatus]
MSGPIRKPTRIASLAAVLAALLPAFFILSALDAITMALAFILVGHVVGGLGDEVRTRSYRWTGRTIVLVGAVVAFVGVARGFAAAPSPRYMVVVGPTLLGAWLLGLGVVPVRKGSRWLVKAGSFVLLAGVIMAGVVQMGDLQTFLLATIAVVVAWDAADHSITLGTQLGRGAKTAQVEVTHLAGTVAMGVVAYLATKAVEGFGTPGVPLAALLGLLAAVLVLTIALHR